MAWDFLSSDIEIPYILESQKDEDKPLKLWVSYMNHVDHEELMAKQNGEIAEAFDRRLIREIISRFNKHIFLKYVHRAENFRIDGKESQDIEKLYSNLDVASKNEIIGVLSNHSKLTELQRKNSEGG